MGVRVALGADRGDLLRLLTWDSLEPVVTGVVLGIVAALLAGRVVLAAMIIGVSPQDPIAIIGAVAMRIAATTVAVLMPTRRAAAADSGGGVAVALTGANPTVYRSCDLTVPGTVKSQLLRCAVKQFLRLCGAWHRQYGTVSTQGSRDASSSAC